MTVLTFAHQVQQQHQEVAPPATPPVATTIDSDIAAFLAEGHKPDETPEAASVPDADSAEEQATDDVSSEPAEGDSADTDGDGSSEPVTGGSAAKLDVAAIQAAVDAADPAAFIKALGSHAEKLLSGKAHGALRIAAKEVETIRATAVSEQAKAKDLAVKLGEKYGDPISARRAAESGEVDPFVDMVEKWAGHPWADVMRWVTSGMAGRKERLEAKTRTENAATVTASAQQEQKVAEVRAWVDGGVKKLAPELHDPEVVDMVVAEIRAGYSKGVNTPAKALPLVRAKLEARYKRLHAVFGKGGTKPGKSPSPASVEAHTQRVGGTRPTSLEEDIAWTKKMAGVK